MGGEPQNTVISAYQGIRPIVSTLAILSACNARDLGLIPGSGSSPGKEIGYPHQGLLPWWISQ